jgi:hypothetical protein
MTVTTHQYVDEGLRLVGEGDKRGLRLRILGSLAIRLHCPENLPLLETMERGSPADIDFAAAGKQARDVVRFLREEGYVEDEKITIATEGTRYSLSHPETGVCLDVFVERLDFCHRIPFEERLGLDAPTLPTPDLLLGKLQIVEINLKDIKDAIVLLLEHPVVDHRNGPDTIDASYVADLLSGDWGFYYTVVENLEKVRRFVGQFDVISPEQARVVHERIDALKQLIEDAPKTRKWKMRAKVGPKVRWYQEVSEKDSGL